MRERAPVVTMGAEIAGRMTIQDADLLKPSLGEDDDAIGFAAPWQPWSVVFAAFFCGPFGGGALMAWNFRRLGSNRTVLPCAATFLLLGIGLAFGAVALTTNAEAAVTSSGMITRVLTKAATVITAMVFASMQSRRFRVFESHGGEASGILGWGVLMFALGTVLTLGARMAAAIALDLG